VAGKAASEPADGPGHVADDEQDQERAVKQLMRHLLSKPPEPRSAKGPKGTPRRPPKRSK
jgi:hypothetical protein